MQIQRGQNLGQMHQKLGIESGARVAFELTPRGITIWDLSGEKVFDVDQSGTVTWDDYDVPKYIRDIIAAPDDQLKRQWKATEGWDEERETFMTELVFSGINILELDFPGARQHSQQSERS